MIAWRINFLSRLVSQACRRDYSVASVEMYALKVAASLTVGIASGLWMFSPKTCQSWSACVNCLSRSTATAGDKSHRPTSLVRPVMPPARNNNHQELSSSLSPAAGAAGVGGGKGGSLYSAIDIQQRSNTNTVGRRTGDLSLTTIL